MPVCTKTHTEILSHTEAGTQRKREAIQLCKDTTHKLYMTGYFLLYFNYSVDTSQGTVAMSWFSGW